MPDHDQSAAAVVRGAFEDAAAISHERIESVDPDADVWRALDLDSLDHLAVMVRLAEVTGRDIAERDYPRLLSLGQLEAHVARVRG